MKTEVRSIQVLRGLAAVAVAFYHTHLILMQYSDVDILGWIALHGKAGVNVFFVLSGFIILKAHREDAGDIGSIPRYLHRRFVRVYPLYWIFSALYMAAALAKIGNPEFSWSPGNLLSAFALFECGSEPSLPLQVGWTLIHEVRFYLAFVLILVSPLLGFAAFTAWTAVILVSLFTGGAVTGWASPWALYFMAGMLVYLASNVLPRWTAWVALAIAAALTIIYFAMPGLHVTYGGGNILPSLLWLLPVCALGLFGAVQLETPREYKGRGLWTRLGDASYSIYLVHSGVISLAAIVAMKFHLVKVLGGYPIFAVTFVAAVAAGYVAHVLVETPLLALLRRKKPVLQPLVG